MDPEIFSRQLELVEIRFLRYNRTINQLEKSSAVGGDNNTSCFSCIGGSVAIGSSNFGSTGGASLPS